MIASTNFLPLPELEYGDDRAFKKRTHNDGLRTRKRPPKLTQKQNDSMYNRSINHSIPHAISFRQSTTAAANISSTINNASSSTSNDESQLLLKSSIYRPHLRESYFEQCFDVVERIGEGSFGEVFKVRSKEDGQLYAIKKSLQLYRGESSRQEKIEEVRRYEQFSEHEHCITLHKAWEQNDLLYMQLELCKCNLETYVMQSNVMLSETEVWNFLVDLLLAVKALHDQNLIHLDIKLENIMITEHNVCKLGDFGLVADLRAPNLRDSSEGDCRYIARETLGNVFTKAADIFSLGMTILELASKMELPKNGYLWHELRGGRLPDHYLPHLSVELQNVIKWMMHPHYQHRPCVDDLLAVPQIKHILMCRRLMKPIVKIKKFGRSLLNRWYMVKVYLVNLFVSMFSFFKLKRLKASNQCHNIALTSTPTAPSIAVHRTSDDSFLRLDHSGIDFDESPSNRSSGNRSMGKSPNSLIVNSTPLNHHSSHGNSRRSRIMEFSRTSLVFDDSDCQPGGGSLLANGASPLKRKKLFDGSDDSN